MVLEYEVKTFYVTLHYQDVFLSAYKYFFAYFSSKIQALKIFAIDSNIAITNTVKSNF